MKSKKRGFTLIELLVVIAIIAILMVVVVITLNPGQLLAQSRDSNRLSDMATLKTALTLYTADVATTTNLAPNTKTCYSYLVSSTCTTWFPSITNYSVAPSSTGRNVNSATNGVDWLPVNFGAISSGAPFTQLPIDPTNSVTNNLYYAYTASGTALWKLDAHMESTKFQQNGTGDVCSTDGGADPVSYELGPGSTNSTSTSL